MAEQKQCCLCGAVGHDSKDCGMRAAKCQCCGTHEVAVLVECHNSACSNYAQQVTVHEGWKQQAARAQPAEHGCDVDQDDLLARVMHERNALMRHIRNAAVRAGICSADAALEGPQLLMLCDDLATAATAQPAGEAVAWLISVDGEPELGHWFAEEPCNVAGHICQPLYTAPPAQVPDGWQPIEAAPKDGTAILLHYKNELGNGRTVKANFIQKFTEESMDENWFDSRDDGACFVPEGWYELIDNWPEYTSVYINYAPTHWMPLPAAPQPKGGE